MKIYSFSLLILLSVKLTAQPFTPDKYGYVADPKFHKLIKERGYELVADFHKVESGNDSLYASVYINGDWKYINVYGDLKTTLFDYQKRDRELELYSSEYFGSDFYEAEPMPGMEGEKPYSEYVVTKPAGKKWGTVHYKTEAEGLPFIYDRVSYFSPTIVIIQQDKKYGLAYSKGGVIVKPKYDYISSLHRESKNYLAVKNGNKFGVIDITGKLTTPFMYDKLYWCSGCGNDLINVSLNKKWGIITAENKQILPIAYSEIKSQYYGVIRVKTSSTKKYGLIDSKGNFILDTTHDNIESRKHPTFITYRKGGLEGLLTNKGKPLVPLIYNSIQRFKKGYAVVEKNGLRGMINKKGKLIIPVHYKVLYIDTKKGQIMAMDSLDKWGYIDFKNKVKIKFKYDELDDIGKGEFFFKRDGEYGLMTSKEVVFKKFKYKYVRKIGAFYLVKENNLSGIIDENGKILLPIKYAYIKDAHDFYQHGYCKVRINGRYYGVDRYGNEALLRR